MEKPQRKHPRLKEYDYNLPGFYYVTIHNEKEQPPLSIVKPGTIFTPPKVILTPLGKIVEQELLQLQTRYPYVRVDKYVCMPTHIHAIIQLTESDNIQDQLSIPDLVCAFKSLATRACNKAFQTPGRKLFQASFYDTVLRNEQAYQACWRYIDENPIKWSTEPEDR